MAGIPGDPISSFASSLGGGIGNGIGDALGGGSSPLLSSASSATYGTTIGNDGWIINFGSGAQWASPVSTSSASYPPDAQPNPFTGFTGGPQQRPPMQAGYGGGNTLGMLAIAGLLAFKILRRG